MTSVVRASDVNEVKLGQGVEHRDSGEMEYYRFLGNKGSTLTMSMFKMECSGNPIIVT